MRLPKPRRRDLEPGEMQWAFYSPPVFLIRADSVDSPAFQWLGTPNAAPRDVATATIAFTSDRDGSPEIYLMNADGSAMSRLTHDGDNAFPAWSPDGEKIVSCTAYLKSIHECRRQQLNAIDRRSRCAAALWVGAGKRLEKVRTGVGL